MNDRDPYDLTFAQAIGLFLGLVFGVLAATLLMVLVVI